MTQVIAPAKTSSLELVRGLLTASLMSIRDTTAASLPSRATTPQTPPVPPKKDPPVSKTQSSTSSASTPTHHFVQEALSNFPKWDLNQNGVLSRPEIDYAIMDRSNQDWSAATSVTLRTSFTTIEAINHDPHPTEHGISKADLEQLRHHSHTAQALELQVHDTQNKIANTPQRLFPQGELSPDASQQATIGDCSFLSALGSFVDRFPKELPSRISQRPDGRYKVNFPTGASVTIEPLTDGEKGLYGSADGLWFPLMEKAAGTLRTNLGQSLARIVPGDAIHALSMKEASELLMGTTHSVFTKGQLASVRSTLKKIVRQNLVASAGSFPVSASVTQNQGIVPSHAYTILNFDAKQDKVQLRNPWGFQEHMSGPLLDQTDDGKFWMKVDDFMKHFEVINYAPPNRKKTTSPPATDTVR